MKNLSLAILTLALLTACGQRQATAASDATVAVAAAAHAAGEAGAAADEVARARADAALIEDGARRLLAYKRAMLPLVAGNYGGACSTAAGVKSRSTIVVAADGTVSSPGMQTRAILDGDVMLSLITQSSVGPAKPLSFVAGSDAQSWSMSGFPTSNMPSVFISAEGVGISCDADSDAPARAVPVYPALAGFFTPAATTLKCTDGSALPKPYKITPSATGVTIGSDTYTLVRPNAGETATAGGPDGGLIYNFAVIDAETVQIQLDRSGKISAFSALGGPTKKLYSCFPEQQ